MHQFLRKVISFFINHRKKTQMKRLSKQGIPYRRRGIHIISLAVDAPQDVISALSGKLGRLEGVAAKTAYSNYSFPGEADT